MAFQKQFLSLPSLRLLPEDPLRLAGHPGVKADGSKMTFPLVHFVRSYRREVQALPVARGPILRLRCGRLQQQLVRANRLPLFVLD